jgi:hypothetical protein
MPNRAHSVGMRSAHGKYTTLIVLLSQLTCESVMLKVAAAGEPEHHEQHEDETNLTSRTVVGNGTEPWIAQSGCDVQEELMGGKAC